MPLPERHLRIFGAPLSDWKPRKPRARRDPEGFPRLSHHRTSRQPKSADRSLRSFLRLLLVLVIDHHALQRIDGSIKLRIFLFADKFLFVGGKRGIAPLQKQSPLLVRSERGPDIWRHPFFVNDLFSRGVIFGGRQA